MRPHTRLNCVTDPRYAFDTPPTTEFVLCSCKVTLNRAKSASAIAAARQAEGVLCSAERQDGLCDRRCPDLRNQKVPHEELCRLAQASK